ncbi:MAG: DNA polymerase III subunit beta [Candidatus Lightella neohaematopini]|nr:DNA polymerase III subunit beta [Candidatus Lightella neohaematopini]MCV2528791.1 DNA polymerase III subunit beta [Candidatus Lightella neohaematopini]
MKFSVENINLIKLLQNLYTLTSNNLSLPILNNVLIKVFDDYILFIKTNIEIEIIAKMSDCNTIRTGVITVSIKKLYNICRKLPNNSIIYVSLKDKKLIIKTKNSLYSLSTLPDKGFPKISYRKNNINYTLSSNILLNALSCTYFSMAKQDARYYLNGILFKISSNIMYVVSTNGHRLSICETSINFNILNLSIIIPRNGILELMKLLNKHECLINIFFNRESISLIINNYIFTSRLIDGIFPNFISVIPKDINIQISLNLKELKSALNRIITIINDKSYGIKLIISKNKLVLIANNLDFEIAKEIIIIKYDGKNVEFAFNAIYILDVLNVLQCKILTLAFTDNGILKISDSMSHQSLTYVIMPMKI